MTRLMLWLFIMVLIVMLGGVLALMMTKDPGVMYFTRDESKAFFWLEVAAARRDERVTRQFDQHAQRLFEIDRMHKSTVFCT